jgi:radical SAM superfamily enzyme YgiQ (UPF0313 family)
MSEPEIQIEVLDGNIIDFHQIISKIPVDAQIFGISSFTYNHQNAVKLANYIKTLVPSSVIVFGGGMPTALPDIILNNHKEIDYIIVNEGEYAFAALVSGKPPESINNLVFRSNAGIMHQPGRSVVLDSLPLIQYDKIVDINSYFSNADRQNEKRKLPIYTSKGCKYRESGDSYCVFCSEMYSTFRKRDPSRVWEEILHLKNLGAAEAIDAADNFMEDMQWFNEFYKQRQETDIDLKIYSRADSLNEDTVRKLKNLRVTGILIGIESNSDYVLKKMGKIARSANNEKALDLLRKYGIMPRITMILGGEGETIQTAMETLRFAENYLGNDCWITCSILKPLPGSRAFSMLKNVPDLGGKYNNKDLFDFTEMSRDWVKYFCQANYDELLNIEKKIISLSQKRCSWDNNIKLF